MDNQEVEDVTERITFPNNDDVECEDEWEFEDILGSGCFSDVVLGTNKKDPNIRRAIKVISKESLKTHKQRWRINNEIELHARCTKHKNVVEFSDYYENDEAVFIVLELCSGGELFERIAEEGRFAEDEARRLMTDILEAINYLHSLGIVHRDLKPENLLFASTQANAPLKLADFGLAKELGGDETNSRDFLKASTSGTTAYCAPERLAREKESKGVDLWSVGCIMYFLLYGVPPFHSTAEDEEDAEDEVFTSIEEGLVKFPEDIPMSQEAKDLILKFLEPNFEKRISAEKALNHPWILKASAKQEGPLKTPTESKKLTASSVFNTDNKETLKMSINKAIDKKKDPSEIEQHNDQPHVHKHV